MTLEFSRQSFEKNQISNFIKIGSELFHDGRTDMTKPTVAFRNFANAPTNGWQEVVMDYVKVFKAPRKNREKLETERIPCPRDQPGTSRTQVGVN
jgi:hypothetical protein